MVDETLPRSDFYVYVIFRPNGQPCYVGKGRGRRWSAHKRKTHNPHLEAIYKMAGNDLPIMKIREGLTDIEACNTEIAFISAIGRKENGGILVNMTNGGDGVSGYKYPPEKRERHRNIMNSSDVVAKRRAAHLGSIRSDEHRNNIRKALQSPETKEKMRLSHLGKKHSPETNAKRAAKNKGKKRSEEFCLRMRARKGEKRSAEARANMSAACKGRIQTEEHRRRIRNGNILRYKNKEERKKTSDGMKLVWEKRKAKAENVCRS